MMRRRKLKGETNTSIRHVTRGSRKHPTQEVRVKKNVNVAAIAAECYTRYSLLM